MQLHVLKSTVGDNFFYLLAADDGADGLLIDPVDAKTALAAVSQLGIHLRYLVNTHGHPDHTAGNSEVVDATGVEVYAHDGDKGWIGKVDHCLDEGDDIQVGDTALRVLHTPGHTPGHISLYTPGHLFCGDAIFVAGAGNCRFGGNPGVLYATFANKFGALPGDTVIYPGHNYAPRNLEFAQSLDSGCEAVETKLVEARQTVGHCLATLAEERAYNPFMRLSDPNFRKAFQQTHPDVIGDSSSDEDVFVALRGLRDTW